MRIAKALATAALLLTILSAGCSPCSGERSSTAEREPLEVFLVRHAEKVDQGDDPGLSEAGRARTAALAEALRDAGIDHVHSSDYARTRETAAPIADERGLDLELYDPRDLPGLVERLHRTGGRQLVVGHSNTTHAMVELLGAVPGSPIDDDGEFDRLYIVTVGRDGKTTTVLLRYGRPYRSAKNDLVQGS